MNRAKNNVSFLLTALSIIISFITITTYAIASTMMVNASSLTDVTTSTITTKPTGNVVNTKYLTITEHSYIEGPLFTIINGTVVNNSTTPINSVRIQVEFYDEDGKLITTNSETADFVILRPGDNSPFAVLTQLRNETVDRYRALPGGDIGG